MQINTSVCWAHTLLFPSHPQQTPRKSQFGDYRLKRIVTEVLEYTKPNIFIFQMKAVNFHEMY